MKERDPNLPAEQQGIFRKFDVRRVDGKDAPGEKHHDCEYFVVDVDHDQHSPAALIAYAISCKDSHPKLSSELLDRFALLDDSPETRLCLEMMGHCISYLARRN